MNIENKKARVGLLRYVYLHTYLFVLVKGKGADELAGFFASAIVAIAVGAVIVGAFLCLNVLGIDFYSTLVSWWIRNRNGATKLIVVVLFFIVYTFTHHRYAQCA